MTQLPNIGELSESLHLLAASAVIIFGVVVAAVVCGALDFILPTFRQPPPFEEAADELEEGE